MTVQEYWNKVQKFLDVDGDVWMGLFTAFILARLILVLKGYPPLTLPESGAYSSAVGAFAYSNRKDKLDVDKRPREENPTPKS
jgi:hypothetical protein